MIDSSAGRPLPRKFACAVVVAMGSLLSLSAVAGETMKLTMQPQKGSFTEQCFTLESGQKLAYQFTTRHPIDFNLHHHPANGDTVFPDRLVVKSQHSKSIVAESAGAYCFMATNVDDQSAGFEVVINYQITKP